VTLKLYRPTPDGKMEPSPAEPKDYRRQLRSRRWNAAPLANPEVATTSPWLAVLFIAALCALTFVLLVAGYASGFWG
jgi:hypothetical protein